MNGDDILDYTKPPRDPRFDSMHRKKAYAAAWAAFESRRYGVRGMSEQDLLAAEALLQQAEASLDGVYHFMQRRVIVAIVRRQVKAGKTYEEISKAMGLSVSLIANAFYEATSYPAKCGEAFRGTRMHASPSRRHGVYLALIDPDSPELCDGHEEA